MEISVLKYNPFAKLFDRFKIKEELKKEEELSKNSQGISQEDLESLMYESRLGFSRDENIVVTSIDFDQLFKSKSSRISKYREMSMFPEIGEALDYVADEAITENDQGKVLSLEFTDDQLPRAVEKKIRGIFDYLVDDVLQVNENMWDWFKTFLIEAELYMEMIMDSSKKNLIGFKKLPGYSMMPIYKNGLIVAYRQIIPDVKGKELDSFVPNQIPYVNYGLYGTNKADVRGYLESSIKIYNQLRNLEDALIVYRLVRSTERRVWNIDVGKMPKGKAEAYMQNLIRQYKQKLIYDTETGKVNSAQNVQALTEDFWFAKREGSEGSNVQQLAGGVQLGELTDVNYFLEKLNKCLKLPRSRWDKTQPSMFSIGRSSELNREEVKFGNFVGRLRTRFSHLVLNPFLTLLKMRGIDEQYIRKDLFKIDFEENSYFKEIKELEANQERLNILSTATSFVSGPMNKNDPNAIFAKEYVVRNIYKMKDEDYKLNKELLEKEEKENPPVDQFGGMGGQFGGQDPNAGGEEAPIPPPQDEEFPPEEGAVKEENKRPKKKLLIGDNVVEKGFMRYVKGIV